METQTSMSSAPRPRPGPLRMLALAMLVGSLAGCASTATQSLQLQGIGPAADATGAGKAAPVELKRAVSVVRQGREIGVEVPMALEPGDEVEVRTGAMALLGFPGGHEVTLLPGTRVRVGSIFHYFGELIVKAKGYFRVETEYWTAGVKGTEFEVQLSPDKRGKVSVVEGTISLTSRTAPWPETEVRANEVAILQGAAPPTKTLMTRSQIDTIKTQLRRSMRLRPPPRLRPR